MRAALLFLLVVALGMLCVWLGAIAVSRAWALLQPVGPALFLSCCALALLVLAFWYPVADAWPGWRRAHWRRPMASRR
jgi:hypothetical protein